MSVLSKEEYFDSLRHAVGDEATDENIKMIEDFTDTYNDLEARATSGEADEWKKKFEDNDRMWRNLYSNRFFSSPSSASNPNSPEHATADETERAETIQVQDLFTAPSR